MVDSLVVVVLTTPNRQKLGGALRDRVGKECLAILYVDTNLEGAAIATQKAIQLAVDTAPGAHVLFLEDDVYVHPSAIARVRQLADDYPRGVGVISFCDMREMPNGAPPDLYVKSALGCDQRGWWGDQAILIHCDVAECLVKQDWFSPEINRFPGVLAHAVSFADGGKNCSDIRLSYLVDKHPSRYLYAVHVPSLFRHDGCRSECFPDRLPVLGERETRNWIDDSIVKDTKNEY